MRRSLIEQAFLLGRFGSRRAGVCNISTHEVTSSHGDDRQKQAIKARITLSMRNKRPTPCSWIEDGYKFKPLDMSTVWSAQDNVLTILDAVSWCSCPTAEVEDWGCSQKSIEFIQASSRCLLKQEVPEIKYVKRVYHHERQVWQGGERACLTKNAITAGATKP